MRYHPPGTLIAGRYEVAGRPMMGGMGIVYVCLDLEEDRPVALKTFQPEYLPDRAARDRFLREGTHWVDLGTHPHIVRCYEVLRVGDGTEVYLVLELVAKEQDRENASLRSWLTPGVPLSVDAALLFALQIARGMQHAVETIPGFVHRDLKPENVLIGADRLPGTSINRLRVTDFGLAATLEAAVDQRSVVRDQGMGDSSSLRRTQLTRGVVGTPLYMAREQWRGEPVTVSADVYALGCILYEMLAGRRAVAGEGLAAVQRAHCSGEVRPLPREVSGAVGEVVARCLVLTPGDRYTGWTEVEAALAGAYRVVSGRTAPPAESATLTGQEERCAAGWSYSTIGQAYLDIGKPEVARGYFERAEAVGKKERKRTLVAAALGNLGLACRLLGNARRAISYHEQALAIFREIGDRRLEGNAVTGLGNAYADLGDVRRAIGFYDRAAAIAREIGDRCGEGNVMTGLGNAYNDLGDARRAIGYYDRAVAIALEIGDRRGVGVGFIDLGDAYFQLGDARRAIGYHEQALAIVQEIGDRRGEGQALGNLGNAYNDLGDTHRAIGYLEQHLEITREIGDQRWEGHALGNLGAAHARLGDARRAIYYFKQHLGIAREIGDWQGEGKALANLGSSHFQLGRGRRAVEYWQRAAAIFEEIGDVMSAANIDFNLAVLLVKQEHSPEALPHAERAAEVFAQVGHVQYAQQAQQLLTKIRAELG